MSVAGAPYRGLDPFTDSEEDAALFFGREDEVRIAAANLLTSRLTLLYGPSGVGKSSLLHAGLVNRVHDADDEQPMRRVAVVVDTWAVDPAAEVTRRAAAALGVAAEY